jgi:hypothetical protein
MNQYTIARDAGLKPGDDGWPKQKETRRPMKEETKEKISQSMVIRGMQKMIDDPDTPPTVRATLYTKLLDKVVPTLSSVDSTIRDKTAEMNEEALVARLRTLIEANPSLASKVFGDNARQSKEGIKEVKAA